VAISRFASAISETVAVTALLSLGRFQLCKEQKIEFNQIAIANAEGSEDMLNRVMTKDNIGLVAVLETKEGIYDSGMYSARMLAQSPSSACA